jgi:TolA-binding protein
VVQPVLALAPPPATLSGFYKAIAAEDHAEAERLADRLLRSAPPADRSRVALAYGRVLLGLGDTAAVREYLAAMAREPIDDEGRQLMAVYAAWLDAIDGRPAEAIESLETFIRGHEHTYGAAEAADVLAIIHLAGDDKSAAKRSVDYGLATLKYLAIKTDYLEALLRGRMVPKVPVSEAERLYKAAEKLRQAGKHQEAAARFAAVREKHVHSVWAHASGFRIGQCLAGLGRRPQAVDHWRGFIKEEPQGPWRGQAHVALIDDAMEAGIDLATATKHGTEASRALAGALADEAAPSWAEAALDVHVRQAIVTFVDQRYGESVNACEQALGLLPKRSKGGRVTAGHGDPRVVGLECLKGLAREQRGILPDDVEKGASPQARVALSLGCVNLAFGRSEAAARFFAMAGKGPASGSNALQRAFAQFGLARATLGLPSKTPAKKLPGSKARPALVGASRLYLQSLADGPAGSWNDETLRDVALIVGDAGGDALAHWRDLVQRFPQSRHAAEALFHVGILSAAAESPVDAIRAFETLVKDHPTSPWTGDAAVRLIDIRLEQEYDLPGAVSLAQIAVAWLEKRGDPQPLATGLDAAVSLAPAVEQRLAAAFDAMEPAAITAISRKAAENLPTAQQTGYAIYLRAGLVEYLLEHPEAAVGFFENAKPLAPPRKAVLVGSIPTGLEELIDVARSGVMLTPKEVRAGDPKAKLILMLADVHVKGHEWAKAIELCDKVIQAKNFSVTALQKSWAYHQKATAIYGIPDCANAFDDYVRAQATAPKAPWAAESLFYAGCIANNFRQDSALAMAHYKAVVEKYPAHELASKAAFFIGVRYEAEEDWHRAKAAYTSFLKKYPDSLWVNLVRKYHLPEVEKHLSATSSSIPPASKP